MHSPRRAGEDSGVSPPLTVTSKFELEADLEDPLIRREIERVVGQDDFSSAVGRLLEWGDVAADPRIFSLPDQVVVEETWLSDVPAVTVNNEAGRPIRHLSRQESRVQWERMRMARLRSRLFAILLADALVRIGSSYGPNVDEVASSFLAQFVPVREAETFGRALHYFWEGQHHDAARVALPSVEAVIRSMVRSTRGDSYVEPKGGRDGHESTLGALIRMLPESLPESFRWDLAAVFTEPLGLNLRNVHLHGLAEEGVGRDAAIILYTAARFTLITASPPDDSQT